MKLNLEMIANQIPKEIASLTSAESPEPYLNISDFIPSKKNAKVKYEIVGQEVILTCTDGCLKFRNADPNECFYEICAVFEKYEQWFYTVTEAIFEKFDMQVVINETYKLVKNPMFYLDEELKLMGVTLDYLNDPNLDENWKHLLKKGYFSSKWIYYMHDPSRLKIKKILTSGEYYTDRDFFRYNRFCCDVIINDIRMGFFEVQDYDTKLNYGHFYIYDLLATMVKSKLENSAIKMSYDSAYKQICRIFEGETYEKKLIAYILAGKDWGETDGFFVAVISPKAHDYPDMSGFLNNTKQILESALGDSIISFEYKKKLIVLINKRLCGKKIIAYMKNFASKENLLCGISLKFEEFFSLGIYFKQAEAALNYGANRDKKADFYNFYEHAVELIISGEESLNNVYSCHPDTIAIMSYDEKHNSLYLDTLFAFIVNDCNAAKAAQYLIIHRNTMNYRLQKIYDIIGENFREPYAKEYIILSYRIIKAAKSLQTNNK